MPLRPLLTVTSSFGIALALPACDATDPHAADQPNEPAAMTPGPACLVADADRLDFGTVLSGAREERAVRFAGCDGEPVEVFAVDVPDDGDMLLAVRVVRDGAEVPPLLPFTLAPDEELLVRVIYRARASAADAPVLRHLRVGAESRATPELPGEASVELSAQPVSACPDETCGVAGPSSDRWRLRTTGDGNPGPEGDDERERDYWEQRY